MKKAGFLARLDLSGFFIFCCRSRCCFFLFLGTSIPKSFRDGVLFLLEGTTKLAQGDVLELADTLTSDTKLLADFFQGARLLSGEAKACVNDFALALIKHGQQSIELTVHVFVAEQVKRRLSVFIADDLAELGAVIITDGSIK